MWRGNEYATVLRWWRWMICRWESRGKVLVQVGTTERPRDWKTREATAVVGKEREQVQQVVSFGGKPWQIVKTDVVLTIRNTGLKSAAVLDANGMVVKELPLEDVAGGKRLRLPADALYVVLRK